MAVAPVSEHLDTVINSVLLNDDGFRRRDFLDITGGRIGIVMDGARNPDLRDYAPAHIVELLVQLPAFPPQVIAKDSFLVSMAPAFGTATVVDGLDGGIDFGSAVNDGFQIGPLDVQFKFFFHNS